MQDLFDKLSTLPQDVAEAQRQIDLRKLSISELKESLDIAEVNAALSATLDGKNEAARKLQERAAINNDPNVKTAQKALSAQERDMIFSEYDLNRLQGALKATQYKVELTIAQARLDAEKISLQTAQLKLQAAQLRMQKSSEEK